MYQELIQDSIKNLIAEDYIKGNYGATTDDLSLVYEAIDSLNRQHGNLHIELMNNPNRMPKANQKGNEKKYYYGGKRPYYMLDKRKVGESSVDTLFLPSTLHKNKVWGKLFDNWITELAHAKQYTNQPQSIRDSLESERIKQWNKYGDWGKPGWKPTYTKLWNMDFPDFLHHQDILKLLPESFKKYPYEGTYGISHQDDSGKPTVEYQAEKEYEGLAFNEFLNLINEPSTEVKEGSLEDIVKQLKLRQLSDKLGLESANLLEGLIDDNRKPK
tara:strand:+ start:1570 stop:2385 length:816 start_codon:yes stop_codon:yes gene_type:complete